MRSRAAAEVYDCLMEDDERGWRRCRACKNEAERCRRSRKKKAAAVKGQ